MIEVHVEINCQIEEVFKTGLSLFSSVHQTVIEIKLNPFQMAYGTENYEFHERYSDCTRLVYKNV